MIVEFVCYFNGKMDASVEFFVCSVLDYPILSYLLFCITHGIAAVLICWLLLLAFFTSSPLGPPLWLGSTSAALLLIRLFAYIACCPWTCFLFILMYLDHCLFIGEYVTYLELAAPMHKAVKALYPEYMLFVNKVELSLIIEMLIKY